MTESTFKKIAFVFFIGAVIAALIYWQSVPIKQYFQKLTCEKNDGLWINDEFKPYCSMPLADRGKPCTDGSECQSGTCLADKSHQGGSKQIGKCDTYKAREYNCYDDLIVNGVFEPGNRCGFTQ